jgi:hypothetical protein
MTKIIAIIGAGQLGSRHLQGIAQSSIDISIEIVEPFESSRETAKQRYEEIEGNKHIKEISFYDSIDKLSSNLDMVIVATGADVRTKVVTELLSSKNVENLILEKVLFQTIEEYSQIDTLLKETSTKCWINHPRRMFPIYKKLKIQLEKATQVSYNFQGGDWGLGCNGLHFIDHLAYLVASTNLTLNNEYLDKKLYDSKRKGFIEFNGLLTGKIDNHNFTLYSNENFTPSIFTIVSDVLIANIDEEAGIINISTKENNWNKEVIKEKIIYFQSELSNILIEDILVNDNCFLPTYKEAMNLHVPYIESLLEHMERTTGQSHKLCPIT